MTSSAMKLIAIKGSCSGLPCCAGGSAQRIVGRGNFVNRVVAHQARNGQGQVGGDLVTKCNDQPAAHVAHRAGGGHHRLVVGTDHDQIVMVMGDAARNCALFEADALDEAETDAAAGMVALNHGHFEQVAAGVCHCVAIDNGGIEDACFGDQLIFQCADHAYLLAVRALILKLTLFQAMLTLLLTGLAGRSR